MLPTDWLMLNKSSPLKLLGEIKLNLAGSIYARSSIKHLHLVPFGQQRGEDLFNISQSETRIALGSHIFWKNRMKRRNFIEDLT
jgi:hypothetical protein